MPFDKRPDLPRPVTATISGPDVVHAHVVAQRIQAFTEEPSNSSHQLIAGSRRALAEPAGSVEHWSERALQRSNLATADRAGRRIEAYAGDPANTPLGGVAGAGHGDRAGGDAARAARGGDGAAESAAAPGVD